MPTHFERHIERSVPGYREGHELVVALSDFFLHEGSLAYDLGCSTGALSAKLAVAHAGREAGRESGREASRPPRIVGIEREPAMVAAAREACGPEALGPAARAIEIVEADLVGLELEPCDLVVAYYTLQFVRPAVRQQVFDAVWRSLNWGGAFVLFEKVRAPDARFQDLISTLYVDHKLGQGFSEREIVHKTRSLKGSLEPFSTQGNLDLFARAGFVDVTSVWKYLCFEGFLAIK